MGASGCQSDKESQPSAALAVPGCQPFLQALLADSGRPLPLQELAARLQHLPPTLPPPADPTESQTLAVFWPGALLKQETLGGSPGHWQRRRGLLRWAPRAGPSGLRVSKAAFLLRRRRTGQGCPAPAWSGEDPPGSTSVGGLLLSSPCGAASGEPLRAAAAARIATTYFVRGGAGWKQKRNQKQLPRGL